MNFADVISVEVPEGDVLRISINGTVVWEKDTGDPSIIYEGDFTETVGPSGNEFYFVPKETMTGNNYALILDGTCTYNGTTTVFNEEQVALTYSSGSTSEAWNWMDFQKCPNIIILQHNFSEGRLQMSTSNFTGNLNIKIKKIS